MRTQTQTTTCHACGSAAATTLHDVYDSVVDEELGRLRSELADARRLADHLHIALDSSRRIGAAVGIIMEREKITYDRAFARLVEQSQRARRKVREIAEELLFTGEVSHQQPSDRSRSDEVERPC